MPDGARRLRRSGDWAETRRTQFCGGAQWPDRGRRRTVWHGGAECRVLRHRTGTSVPSRRRLGARLRAAIRVAARPMAVLPSRLGSSGSAVGTAVDSEAGRDQASTLASTFSPATVLMTSCRARTTSGRSAGDCAPTRRSRLQVKWPGDKPASRCARRTRRRRQGFGRPARCHRHPIRPVSRCRQGARSFA